VLQQGLGFVLSPAPGQFLLKILCFGRSSLVIGRVFKAMNGLRNGHRSPEKLIRIAFVAEADLVPTDCEEVPKTSLSVICIKLISTWPKIQPVLCLNVLECQMQPWDSQKAFSEEPGQWQCGCSISTQQR